MPLTLTFLCDRWATKRFCKYKRSKKY